MNVLVVGPESTGGRYMGRTLGEHPDLTVRHWSMPHGPSDGDRHWPTDRNFDDWEFDRAIVTMRAWEPMIQSAAANHTRNHGEHRFQVARANARTALTKIVLYMAEHEKLWRWVSYEELVHAPADVFRGIYEFLGVDYQAPSEPVKDGNVKWHVSD